MLDLINLLLRILFKYSIWYSFKHCLGLELPVALLHGPDGDDDPAAHPEDPCQLPDGPDPPLCGGNVVDHGNGQNCIKSFILVRQRHVITDQYLQLRIKLENGLHYCLLFREYVMEVSNL